MLTNEPEVNIDYEHFHNKLFNIYNESFLIKVKPIKLQKKIKPWFTVGVLNFAIGKNKLYTKCMQTK